MKLKQFSPVDIVMRSRCCLQLPVYIWATQQHIVRMRHTVPGLRCTGSWTLRMEVEAAVVSVLHVFTYPPIHNWTLEKKHIQAADKCIKEQTLSACMNTCTEFSVLVIDESIKMFPRLHTTEVAGSGPYKAPPDTFVCKCSGLQCNCERVCRCMFCQLQSFP